MFRSSLHSVTVTTGPLRGSHDADVAHSENESDTPGLGHTESVLTERSKFVFPNTRSHGLTEPGIELADALIDHLFTTEPQPPD